MFLSLFRLTELKRWAASPKSFTLDFGDYEADYYTVITNEGESMSQVTSPPYASLSQPVSLSLNVCSNLSLLQLIAGYIDIILKRRKDMGKVELEDDSIMAVEEFVAPVRKKSIAFIFFSSHSLSPFIRSVRMPSRRPSRTSALVRSRAASRKKA